MKKYQLAARQTAYRWCDCYGVTKHFLIVSDACSIGGNLMTGSVIMAVSPWIWRSCPEVVSTAIVILLNGNAVKLPSKYLFLHPQTWAVFSLGMRPSLYRGQLSMERSINGQLRIRDRVLSSMQAVCINPTSHPDSGNTGRGGRQNVRDRGWGIEV